MRKQILLTLLAGFLLTVFFLLPKNRGWFTTRIIGYWNDFLQQHDKLDLEERKTARWGSDYTVSKQIAALFPTPAKAKEALLLVPPTSYFKDRKFEYHVPEPAVFYYYTGLKTTWINSALAPQANWMILAGNGRLILQEVHDKKALADSLLAWKKYPVSL